MWNRPSTQYLLQFGSFWVSPQKREVSETCGKVWRKEDLHLVEKDHIREYLNKLDICKLKRLDKMHLQNVGELTDVIVRSFLIIFESLCWLAEVPEVWKKANITAPFIKGDKEEMENYRFVSLTSISVKMMEKILLEIISKY